MLARLRTMSWGVQSEPPPAGLAGENSISTILGLMGLIYVVSRGRKVYVVLKEFALAINKRMGEGEAGLVLVQVHSKEEVFALWTGCGQQSGKFMYK